MSEGAPVEIPEDLWPLAEGPSAPEAIQSLSGLPDYSGGVAGPCQVLMNVDTQIFEGVNLLHRCAVDGEWGVSFMHYLGNNAWML